MKKIALSYHKLHLKYDRQTALHEKRVGELSKKIADSISSSKELKSNMYYAGLLHDIGKMFVPLEILKSNNDLSDKERDLIEDHSEDGAILLEELEFNDMIIKAVRYHHERLDGSGYPFKLKGNNIPIESRILAVADVYDAMSSVRPYRSEPIADDEILNIMLKDSRVYYDPMIMNILEGIITDNDLQDDVSLCL